MVVAGFPPEAPACQSEAAGRDCLRHVACVNFVGQGFILAKLQP